MSKLINPEVCLLWYFYEYLFLICLNLKKKKNYKIIKTGKRALRIGEEIENSPKKLNSASFKNQIYKGKTEIDTTER